MDRKTERGGLAGTIGAFVGGFTCCALVARLLLPAPVEATSTDFELVRPAEVVSAVGDSVISLETYAKVSAGRPPAGLAAFFSVEPSAEPMAVASGVIISSSGYVVTNNHVVSDAGRLRARLKDGRECDAAVVGRDPESDLAVLRIRAGRLTSAPVGDSKRVRAGDSVVAIGNPLGFENSVSLGVVSANRRGPFRVDGTTLGDMIQTDAAINQGNSGGGLFDAGGKLIGINSAIMAPRGGSGSIGIAFAIPTHRMKPVVDTLIALGRVPRPWLGIKYRLSRGSSLSHRPRGGPGVLVEDVVPASPADRAGLQAADIIRQLGHHRVRCSDDIFSFIEGTRPGEKVRARVLRAGQLRSVEMVLTERP